MEAISRTGGADVGDGEAAEVVGHAGAHLPGARCARSDGPFGAHGRRAGEKSAKPAQSPEEQSKQADRHRRLHQHGAVEACFKGGNLCTQVGLRR